METSELANKHETTIYPPWLHNFVEIYQSLGVNNLELLDQIYHPQVNFVDPAHEISGIANLRKYFNNLYTNLASCEFTIDNVFYQNNQAAIYWTMRYQHPKLNSGNTVTVEGHSTIQGTGELVTYHRDYVDLGSMLYEQIPVLGRVIGYLKARMN